MTEAQKLKMLKTMSGETDRPTLLAYLSLAAGKVLKRLYPYRSDVRRVPAKYAVNQVEIACYLLSKRGADGQLTHHENGIIRSYESASVPESMLKDIVPFASVLL